MQPPLLLRPLLPPRRRLVLLVPPIDNQVSLAHQRPDFLQNVINHTSVREREDDDPRVVGSESGDQLLESRESMDEGGVESFGLSSLLEGSFDGFGVFVEGSDVRSVLGEEEGHSL